MAKRKRRVLVLERHSVAGGLTQTFRRQNWNFAPGVHYIGGVGQHPGQEGRFGRLLAWLSDDALSFTAGANPYDIIHLPGFEFGVAHLESACREALLVRFPQQEAAIAGWFAACEAVRKRALTLFALHSMPACLSWGLRLRRGAEAEHWARRTVAEELAKVWTSPARACWAHSWAGFTAAAAVEPALWSELSRWNGELEVTEGKSARSTGRHDLRSVSTTGGCYRQPNLLW